MFNSFVAFISSLLTDAVIQEVVLQAWDECLLELPAKKTVILKQPFSCSWYSVTFTKTYPQPFWQTFWMLNRIQDYDVLKWCKWHNSCRKRVEITWPFFYDLITIGEKNLHYVQHPILSQQTMAVCPNLFYLKQAQPCGFKVFRCKDLSFQNYLCIYI